MSVVLHAGGDLLVIYIFENIAEFALESFFCGNAEAFEHYSAFISLFCEGPASIFRKKFYDVMCLLGKHLRGMFVEEGHSLTHTVWESGFVRIP